MVLTESPPWEDQEFVQWVDAARLGSLEALGRLLEFYRNYLLLVANRELGHSFRSKVGPSDLVQETFLEAQRDFNRFQGRTTEELRGWLRRILLHNLETAEEYYETDMRQVCREVSLAEVPLQELSDVV